jgi:hypothetical protein
MGLGLILLGDDRSLILYFAVGALIYTFTLACLRGIPREVQAFFSSPGTGSSLDE